MGRRRLRTGVSILEVLFAILITAIGLMGAIAVFPAAMLQAKRGMQADGAAVAGLTGIHRFDAEGMRQPNRWLLAGNSAPSSPPWPAYPAGQSAPRVPPPDGQFAFCIDPRFVAANTGDTNANYFPYGATASPIARVTLNDGSPGSTTRMSALHAELCFRVEDDIAYDRFKDGIVVRDDTLQAASQFVGGYGNAQKRQTLGHVSWMATLAPKLERQPTISPLEDRYVLSVVVFQNRPTELGTAYPASEWTANVTALGGWVNGGDVTLTAPASLPSGMQTSAEAVDVKTGQWIMLVAQTNSGGQNSRRMPICRWYRVIDSDEPNTTATPATCAVTLAGADFTDFTNGPAITAIICKGVIAVFEKTIKLEPGL